MKHFDVPIWQKLAITVDEAAAYSSIGVEKVYEMVNDPACPFVLFIGRRRLIKRREFEKFISSRYEV